MRHRYNRFLQLTVWVQKKSNVVRNLITSLLKYKRITTTPKRAKVLKYEVEKLFAKLVKTYNKYSDEKDSLREVRRILNSIVFEDNIIDSIINDKLLAYIDEKRTSGFIRLYRVWVRKWDNVEKVMVELI